MEADDRIIVSVKVRNVGSAAGKEVIEVYYGAPQASSARRQRALPHMKKRVNMRAFIMCSMVQSLRCSGSGRMISGSKS